MTYLRTSICLAIGVLAPLLTATLLLNAAPAPASGYSLTVVRKPGAIFAGLSRDGDAVLVTDLAEGRLYRRTLDGAFTAFGPVLPHGLDVIGDPTGPYRVERRGGTFLVAQGWTASDADDGPFDHALLEIDEAGVRVVHDDFWNPYDFVVDGETIHLVDAARNSIERLTGDGERSTAFTFPRLEVRESALKSLSPTEFSGDSSYEVDAVPTGIAVFQDRLFVSLFTGFPYITGAGEIVSLSRLDDEPALRVEIDGLDAPVDIAFAPDGSLLVLEHGTYDQMTGFVPGSGRLISIDRATGDRRVLIDRLTRPVALLVYDENTIVITELGESLLFLTRDAAD